MLVALVGCGSVAPGVDASADAAPDTEIEAGADIAVEASVPHCVLGDASIECTNAVAQCNCPTSCSIAGSAGVCE